jgi:hypothetical protein
VSQSFLTESVVEDAAMAWLESLGYRVKHIPEIAPGERLLTRMNYGSVVSVAGLAATCARNATTQREGNVQKIRQFRCGQVTVSGKEIVGR